MSTVCVNERRIFEKIWKQTKKIKWNARSEKSDVNYKEFISQA